MEIKSPAFPHQGRIPPKYTCMGKDINPPLTFNNIPPHTVSLVLLMDDPDVPASLRKDQMWDHWIVFNIPPNTHALQENTLPPGVQGRGTGGKIGYQGPCPPDREHRYFFKLYALDILLSLPPGSTKKEVETAMQSHILAQAELIGLFNK